MKNCIQVLILFYFILFSGVISQPLSNNGYHKQISFLNIENRMNSGCYKNDTGKITLQKYSFINFALQPIVGTATAAVFSFFPTTFTFAVAFSGNSSPIIEGTLFTIAVSTYLLGAAAGVYWVAKRENPNLSFLNVLLYSFYGGIGTIAVFALLSTQYLTIPAFGGFAAMFLPIIGAMIYTTVIADWRVSQNENEIQTGVKTHQDYINSAQLFNVEIFRIAF